MEEHNWVMYNQLSLAVVLGTDGVGQEWKQRPASLLCGDLPESYSGLGHVASP